MTDLWIIFCGTQHQLRLLDDETIGHRWVQCGVLAGTTLTLLCILTLRPIRNRSYEVFLIVHFVFALCVSLLLNFVAKAADYRTLACFSYLSISTLPDECKFTKSATTWRCIDHVKSSSSLTYYGAWPSMIVWGLDRFLRLVNLSAFNFGYLNPWCQSSKDLNASVEVLSPHFLKVTMYRSKHFHWRPGQSAYLSFPSVSTIPFESHPFTISTIEDDATAAQKKLTFFVRVRSGFTQTLMQTASSDTTYKVFINGPYSSPPVLMGYQTVILIAGWSLLSSSEILLHTDKL